MEKRKYSKTSLQGTLWSEDTSCHETLSCGIFCHLTCKCPSNERNLLCRDTFSVALRCPLIRGFTVHNISVHKQFLVHDQMQFHMKISLCWWTHPKGHFLQQRRCPLIRGFTVNHWEHLYKWEHVCVYSSIAQLCQGILEHSTLWTGFWQILKL